MQISDIMVGQDESITARKALLRWVQRSTAKYPGVRVTDFTNSWKDGLAFNAIIHRSRWSFMRPFMQFKQKLEIGMINILRFFKQHRPDLVDWRSLKNRGIRDRLDSAFHIVEREYGVTRLLDPEGNCLVTLQLTWWWCWWAITDVHTPEPDEKSLITYISSLYDVFPEPPALHPLYDPVNPHSVVYHYLQ